MYNENLERWIYSSIANHFVTLISPFIPIQVEGEHKTNEKKDASVEVRMNGPYFVSYSGGDQANIEINLLVTKAQDNQNFYTLQEKIGIARSAFHSRIGLFKYGTGIQDTGVHFGCFVIQYDKGQLIRVDQFGQIGKDTPTLQASVNAKYSFYFKNKNI